MNGGYLIISKNQADAYALSVKALELGKPVLFYEDDTTCYYIDTISKSGTDIVLTKGGKTITIENDGDITEVGDVLNPVMENIKDLAGNLRFVEGELTLVSIEGVTYTYNKWSLSGSHLMLVLAGNIANDTALISGKMADVYLPEYIFDKITPIFSNIIDRKNFAIYANDYSSQNILVNLLKGLDHLEFGTGSLTLTADRSFRFQFDLLIDAE